MSIDQGTMQAYLNELFQQSDRDPGQQANMYDVGAAVGLERGDAGSLAEELMVQGMVELKTLSGGIGITDHGLSFIGVSSESAPGDNGLKLSGEKISTTDDCKCVEEINRMVRQQIPDLKLESDILEEIIIDLKSIDLQLLSPRPKNQVFKQLFASLHGALEKTATEELTRTLKTVADL